MSRENLRSTFLMNQAMALCALAILLLFSSCKDVGVPPEPPPPPVPTDSIPEVVIDTTWWTTHPQSDIPWPGLADTPWPMFLHDPQHTGRSLYRGPQEGKVEWLFDAGANVYSSPAIDVDGTVYFGAGRNTFAAQPSGIEKWRLSGGGESSPLIASDGTIYIYGRDTSTQYTFLFAHRPDGTLKWKYIVASYGYDLVSPTISKDGQIVYVAAGVIHAVNKDGSLHWKWTPDSADAFRYALTFSPDGSTLYACGTNALYAVDTSGQLKWKYPSTTSNSAVDNDGNVYFGASSGPGASGSVVLSFTQSGTLRWSLSGIVWGPEDPGPVIGGDGAIYITGLRLHAIDPSGKLRWKYPLYYFSQCIPAIDIDGTIYFGTLTTRTASDSINFLAITPKAKTKFRMSLRSPDNSVPDIDSRPAISADGRIYVGSDRPRGFHLYKIK